MSTVQIGMPTQRETVLNRRVRLLVAVTISYNVIEAVVAIVAGGDELGRPVVVVPQLTTAVPARSEVR